MAAGYEIVTRDRATLPETTAGLARLIPTDGDRQAYQVHFVEATVQVLRRAGGRGARGSRKPAAPAGDHVHQTAGWVALAEQSVRGLGGLRRQAGSIGRLSKATAL